MLVTRKNNLLLSLRNIRHCSSMTDAEKTAQFKKNNQLADEQRGIFRVLDIGLKKDEKDKRMNRGNNENRIYPERKMSDVPWSSVWPAPKTFHPHVVPLPVRQGFVRPGEVVPDKKANVELMKIPNFLHATPPAIRQHCAAIAKFCTKWPKELDDPEVRDLLFPVTKSTSDYLNASSNIRDNRSRITTFRIKLNQLYLKPAAREKLIRLLGDRYEAETEEAVIVVDRCPYRKQNAEYFRYLITALYFESNKTESWENKLEYSDEFKFKFENQTMELLESNDVKPNQVSDEVKKVIEHLINEGENENNLAMVKDKVVSELFTDKF